MKSLLSCVAASVVFMASASAWAQADPTAPGPFTVLTAEYDRGDAAFSCPPTEGCEAPNAEIIAEVYYPSDLTAGPFPLVLFLHGNHITCYDPSNGSWQFGGWDQGCEPPFVAVPSYRGYDYVGRVLASHGYIVASISANGINAQTSLGIIDRAHLIEAHIQIWNEFNTVGSTIDGGPFASDFIGAVDMNNIGTMGHSRGGDGVANHYAIFADTSPFPVRAVLPLAPTNFLGAVLPGVDLGVLLPYCDGDVYTLEGSLFYDRSRYLIANDESTKYTFLSLGSNHNFFNTVWTPECWDDANPCWSDDRGEMPVSPGTIDDSAFNWTGDSFCDAASPGNGRLTPAEQRAVGTAYIAAFFRAHLGGETELLPFLRNDVVPPAPLDAEDLHTAYQAPDSRRLDLNRFNDDSELSLTTLVGTGGIRGDVLANGLEVYERCGFSVSEPCFPGAFREVHLTNFFFLDPTLSRARNVWNAATDSLVNELPEGARNVSRYDVLQFRVGVDYLATSPMSSPVEFTVTLSDGVTSASVSTNAQLGSNDLFYPPGDLPPGGSPVSPVMNSVRLPLSLFSGVNLANIESVTFQYDGTPTGGILIADLAFVDEEDEGPVQPFCQATERFVVQRAASVTSPGGLPAVTSSGTGLTLIDLQAQVDGVLSVGPVQINGQAVVDGDVRSESTITVAPTATVTGAVVPFTNVDLPPLPSLPPFPPPSGGNVFVNPGPPVTLPPGSYPSVFVNSGGTLRLQGGDYFFVNLTINAASRVEAAPNTRVFVQNTLAYQSPIVTATSAPQPIFLGYAGTSMLRMEAPFEGTLLAPDAHVVLGSGAGTSFRGTFQARILEVNPQSSLECVAGPGEGPGPEPTCTDGILNGEETDVDCGGPECSRCDVGEMCAIDADCTSDICTGGICQAPPGSITASFVVTNDWGSGYCVTLNVTNNAAVATESWSVEFNTNFSTIYTSWNGVFSGNTGAVTVGPVASWNAEIPPGATNSSVGFCANRAFPGSGSLPFVTNATGTF